MSKGPLCLYDKQNNKWLLVDLLSFGNPVKERCRRCSETVFCLNTFIVGFTLFFLFDFSFFRESPACALTFVVHENVIHFLLPNR